MNKNEFDQDKDFQALHDKYQAESTEQPPEFVDMKILQAAHQAIHKQDEADKAHVSVAKVKKHAWYVPMSFVAMLVLSLSVVLKLAFDPGSVEVEVMDAGLMEPNFSEKEQLEVGEDVKKPAMRIIQVQKFIAKASQLRQEQAASSVARAKKKAKNQLEKHMMMNKQKLAAPSAFTSNKGEKPIESMGAGASMSEVRAPLTGMAQAAPERMAETAMGEGLQNQKSRIDELMQLLETEQFEKLKLGLQRYRMDYPLNKEDALPQRLRVLEVKWETENISKSLHKD